MTRASAWPFLPCWAGLSGGGDEKAATTYAYDAAGNLLTETSPLGSVTTYTHDKEGNVLTQVDENGKQTRVPADPLNYALSSDLPLEDDTDNTIADVYADPTVNLELDFENEQNRRAVMAALYSLKPNHRSILEQRYRYNRTLQEIADDRGVSRQCVNIQETAALKNFKKALNIKTLNRLE